MTTGNFQNLNASHLAVGWFEDQNTLGRLLLRPPFQRRPVWTSEEKSFLIDTILRRYPVPEIYFYLTATGDPSGANKYAIVDGQQRLRACLEFLEDGFPITFDVNKLDPIYTLADTPWYNKRFSELSPDEQDQFRRYKLVVRDLEGVNEAQIRHMFQRLNQSNVVLNDQELRYSMYEGGMLSIVERLVERDEWEHFRLFTPRQRRRMLDSEFIGELVIGHLHWPQNKKDNIDHYYRQYGKFFPFANEVEKRFVEVLSYLEKTFPRPRMNGTRWYRKSDFYTLFLALSRGRISLTQVDPGWLRDKLAQLSAQVDTVVADSDGPPVSVYKAAVERAATDRTRRIRREDALLAFLEDKQSVKTEADESFSGEYVDDSDEEYVDAEPTT